MKKSIERCSRTLPPCAQAAPTPRVLDRISVDYYGTPTPIQQIATIASPDPRLLIHPWDASALKPIEKAIQASDLGINPQNDGKSSA